MYNFKEKQKHLNDLLAPEHAQSDFDLLKSIEPGNINVILTVSVAKSAEKILFNLLDLKTREEIVANRRAKSKKTTAPAAASKTEANTDLTPDPKIDAKTGSAKETKTKPQAIKLEPTTGDSVSEVKAEKAEEIKKKVAKPKDTKKKTSTPISGGSKSSTKTSS